MLKGGLCMGRIAYLDFVAVPIYIVILYAVHIRKMVQGKSNRIFRQLVIISLAAAVADTFAGLSTASSPLSDLKMITAEISTGSYHLFHGFIPVLFLIFLFSETRNWYWLKQKNHLLIMVAPYIAVPLVLAVNLFTGFVFTIDRVNGYVRGPGIYVLYIVAAVYMVWGLVYLFMKRKIMSKTKLVSLLMMYVCNVGAVIFQMIFPMYLVEMIITAVAELFVVLLVLKPEDYLDYSTGLPSFKAYSGEVRKICSGKAKEKIIVMRLINASQLRRYLGEDKYFTFIRSIGGKIKKMLSDRELIFDMYFEQPGRLYMITDSYVLSFEGMLDEVYGVMLQNIF